MEPGEYAALNRLESRYWWHAGLRALTFAALKRYGAASDAPRVLDLGCGAGGLLAVLRTRCARARLVGLDLHPQAILYARARLAAPAQAGSGACVLCRGTANALPFGAGTFDAVLALDLFYARQVDEARALAETHRVLERGGLLILNLPAFEALRGRHDVAVHTRRRYTAAEVRARVEGAGFTLLRLTYWNAILCPVVFAVRRLQRLRTSGGVMRSDLVPLPGPLNGLLKLILAAERALLAHVDLPFGSSVLAVARKAA